MQPWWALEPSFRNIKKILLTQNSSIYIYVCNWQRSQAFLMKVHLKKQQNFSYFFFLENNALIAGKKAFV